MNSLFSASLRGLVAGAGLSTLVAAMVAGPAAAQTAVFTDPRGDVDLGSDILRVRLVNHGQIRVKVVHRDLVRSFKSGSSLSVFIDTDRRRSGPEYLFQGGTYEGSEYALLRANGWTAAKSQAEPMRCPYSMRLDFVRDTALVAIDRSCLGNPGAIRIEVKTGGERAAEDGRPPSTEVDWLGTPRQFTRWVKPG